jgi:hypothetical protein
VSSVPGFLGTCSQCKWSRALVIFPTGHQESANNGNEIPVESTRQSHQFKSRQNVTGSNPCTRSVAPMGRGLAMPCSFCFIRCCAVSIHSCTTARHGIETGSCKLFASDGSFENVQDNVQAQLLFLQLLVCPYENDGWYFTFVLFTACLGTAPLPTSWFSSSHACTQARSA